MNDDSVFGPVGGILIGALLTTGIWANSDSLFPEAYEALIELEGGYANNLYDRGGETMFGVTEVVARECGWRGKMRDYPLHKAAECAYEFYWKPLAADEIATRQDTAYRAFILRLFHTGYHAGPFSATRWFQTCLNELNRNERDYSDVRVDGKIGRRTIRAFRAFRAKRGAEGAAVLSTCLKIGYGWRFRSLIRNNPTQEEFAFGWYRRLGE